MKNTTIIENDIELTSPLQVLELGNNQIISIPESICSLIKLQMLNLSDNKITSIPESIELLINLQELYLYNNQINLIPKSIKNKSYLKL